MTFMKLVIGNKNYSSWSLRPWIFMRICQIPFEEILVPLDTDETAAKLAPFFSGNKVPVLLDGDRTVWDSLAILEYLSETYLAGKGWPADTDKRAFARSISAEMHSGFPALRTQLPMNCRRMIEGFRIPPEAQKDIDRIRAIWEKYRNIYKGDGDWLFGEFSIADAMFTPVVLRFNTYYVPLPGMIGVYARNVLARPELGEWLDAAKQETEVIKQAEV